MVSREKQGHLFWLILLIVLFTLIIVSHIAFVIFFGSKENSSYTNPLVASRVIRGSITDRNGHLLAIETPYYSCAIHIPLMKDAQVVASTLSDILFIDEKLLIENMKNRSSYYLVKRRLTNKEAQLIREARLDGVVLEKRYGRTYPQHYHAGQLVGFTNSENRGLEGLELTYDSLLSPYPALGETLTYGSDLELTLDIQVQYLLDQQVIEIDELHSPSSIVALVMGAQTGEIIASSVFPFYDPNRYQDFDVQRRQHSVVSAMYEPGSVFKIFSLASILHAQQADVDQEFYCDGSYTFYSPSGQATTINCVSAHGVITPETMIKYSCNGAIAHWANQTDPSLFRQGLVDLGFSTVWDVGLSGSIAGSLQPVEKWSSRSAATIAFGQEIGVTALQLATAATAIATGGELMSPSIVKRITNRGTGEEIVFTPQISKCGVITPQEAHIILKGMEEATESGGTASKIAVEGLRIGAKTGTAQLINEETGSYDDDHFLASTLAIVPIEDPVYIIYIGVLHPSGTTIWGSNIASPAIGNLIEDLLRLGKIRY
jgi:cell division protein FtsI (penicillin-binding protein 3)